MAIVCDIRNPDHKNPGAVFPDPPQDIDAAAGNEQVAVLGAGCFWCVEAVFKELAGVLEVTSGYAGGTSATADYKSVCSGTTDHAEVVWVRFDARKIRYGEILKVFFSVAHDPTQFNRQGNDHGRQYRSAIFYSDEAQRSVAEAYIRKLDEAGVFRAKVVTKLEPLNGFYEAEAYHQDYAELHPDQPYIAAVALPKVEKLKKYYPDDLKSAT